MRLLFFILIAAAIACVAAPFTGDFSLFVEAALWIYSLTIAFLVDKAIARRRALKVNVALELARLRHIHHVAEQLGRTYSSKINKLLTIYQTKVASEFISHHKSTDQFRDLSHAIYSFTPKTTKDTILYTDLLSTLQELTLGRQNIQLELQGGLSFYDWLLITLVLACLFILLLVKLDDPSPTLRLGLTFLAILVNLIPLEMLWKDDRFSQKALTKFGLFYRRNIPRD